MGEFLCNIIKKYTPHYAIDTKSVQIGTKEKVNNIY